MNQAATLSFGEVHFDVVDLNNNPWLKSAQLSQALGYKAENSIQKIFERNKDEFTDQMTRNVNLTIQGQDRKTRIFSLRGAHLIAMFARTKVAKDFRKWVLDILDQTSQPTPAQPAISAKTVSPSQKRSIQEFIIAKVRSLPEDLHSKAFAEIYSRLKNKFQVAKYSELSETDYDRALEYVQNMSLKTAASIKALPRTVLIEQSVMEATLLDMEKKAADITGEYFRIGERIIKQAINTINAPGTDRQTAVLHLERAYVDGIMHIDASLRSLRNNLATLSHI